MKNKFLAGMLIIVFIALTTLALITAKMTQSDSIETSFNTSRKILSVDLTSDLIVPDHVARFSRQQTSLSTGNARSGNAIYVRGWILISLSMVQVTDQNFQDMWNGNFLTVSCGDIQGQVETYPQAKMSYRYATCHGLGFLYYEFRWFNNGWMLTASTSSNSGFLDPTVLLEFVNGYPY